MIEPMPPRVCWSLCAVLSACSSAPSDSPIADSTGAASDASTSATATEVDASDTATSLPGSTNATSTTGPSSTGDGTTDTTGGPPDPPPGANPLFDDLGPGEVLDLGPFTCTKPEGEDDWCLGITAYSGMTFDPNAHRVLAFGGGHATTMNDSIHALSLADTPAWSPLYEPTPCSAMTPGNVDAGLGAWISGTSGPYPRPVSAHTYDLVTFAPELDELVLLGRSFTGGYCSGAGNDISGPMAHFDPDAGTWAFSGDASTASVSLAAGEYDPMTGRFVTFGSTGLKIYDPVAREMVTSIDADALDLSGIDVGYANHMVYFPPDDTFYYFLRGSGGQVVALHLDRDDPASSLIEAVATSGGGSPHDEPAYDYDPIRGVIGGAVIDSTFYAFDPPSGAWTATPMTGGAPGKLSSHALVYDGIDDVFLFITDYDSGGRTWAYRHGA